VTGTIVSESAAVEKIAAGFRFTEGPVWFREHGYLVFSDIPANTQYLWKPGEGVRVYRQPSGFDGSEWPDGQEIGSNGLTRDAEGRLTNCEHGNRRVTRVEPDGSVTVLASHWQGRRLNSPNDAVYKSDNSLYFTDPPYGLLNQDEDPAKELVFNGVYRVLNGELDLLVDDLTRPNGLAFSPDERVLYVANSDSSRKVWMRYEVTGDGKLTNGRVFFDAQDEPGDGLPDGMKVDVEGNVYATGPGGVLVFNSDGKHLGTIRLPETPANCGWGDEDGKTLYVTAQTGVYRVRTLIGGQLS
jgi:gluconolactonase